MKVLNFATHPIQYQVPIYRKLAEKVDLTVVYLHQQTEEGQADAGFNVKFQWDIPLYEGYDHIYLKNLSKTPTTQQLKGVVIDERELHAVVEKYQPDKVIIHGWFPMGMRQVLNYCHKKQIPTFCRGDSNQSMTSSWVKQFLKEFFIRNLLRKINYFLIVGSANRAFYKHYGVKEHRLYNAFHCINTPFFKDQFAQVEKISGEKIKVGFAGKLIDKKCPLILLEAIKESKYRSELEVVIIGDGPLRKKMEQYAQEHQLSVHFKGFLNQTQIVPEGYAKIDVLVLPSKEYETWGLVVNEVMTGGIPVIVSDKVGCQIDLVDEGKTGYVFKSQDTKALTKQLDRYVEKVKEGHDFSHDVQQKIEGYSVSNTVNSYLKALSK